MKEENTGIALAAAIENEVVYRRAAEAKARNVDFAKTKRAELVALAASGAELDAGELMKAEHDAQVETAEFEIAEAIHKGAQKRVLEAEISAWFDQAGRLNNAVEQCLDERFAAAAAVDRCLADLDQAVRRFNNAGQQFSNARIAAAQFTGDRDIRIASNPILAAMPAGTHPNAKNNYSAEICEVRAAIFNANGGLERQISIQNLVRREAFLWGRKAVMVESKS